MSELGESERIPLPKGLNKLGIAFIYYRVCVIRENVDVFLTKGTYGNVVGPLERGVFQKLKYYYRSILASEKTLNPKPEQVFGWELDSSSG